MNIQEYTIEVYNHYKLYDVDNIDDILSKYFDESKNYISSNSKEFCDFNYLRAKYLFNHEEYTIAKDYISAAMISYRNDHLIVTFQELLALWIDICGHMNEINQITKTFETYKEWDFNDKEVFMRVMYWMHKLTFPNNIYIFTLFDKLKFKFKGSNYIINNYSEVMQDMFVLSILNGKRHGTYIELGAAEFNKYNNTYLLETIFSWRGFSVEYNIDFVKEFNNNRKNLCIYADATKLDYEYLIKEKLDTNRIDYLQVDLDPANVSFEVLQKMLQTSVRFSIITFEHDIYNTNGDEKYKAKELLEQNGYVLAVSNVNTKNINTPFEDWYIDSQIMDENVKKILSILVDEKYDGFVNNLFYKS